MNKDAKVVPLQLHPMGLIEAFLSLGADLDRLLKGTGITRDLLERKSARISYSQQTRLVHNGIRQCSQPGLGLLVGLNFGWCYHGPVGYVIHCGPSLREAGETFRRYMAIPQPYYALTPKAIRPTGVMESSGRYVHTIRPLPNRSDDEELTRFDVEMRLAIFLRLFDHCGYKGAEDPSVHLRVGYPEPIYSHLFGRLPCASVSFDWPATQVAVHRDFLSESWRPYRRHAFNRLVGHCEETLRQADLRGSYTDVVRTHVSEAFNRTVSLDEVAERLNMTPRALSRRLADEQTTFRSILHEVRMEVTMAHLQASQMRVEEIAEFMGFSCASSLRRAVKRWSGRTAGEIRNAAQELGGEPIASEPMVASSAR